MKESTILPFDIKVEVILLNEIDLSTNFVAIATEIRDQECKHSGLIICFEKKVTFFHYTGEIVKLEDITATLDKNADMYIKKLNIIVEEDVVSFLGHCQKLNTKGISPQYGFVFNNSYYDSTTKDSFLINAIHDITTCVGFCIKVIRGFLYNHDEYLKISDWNQSSLRNAEQWLIDYMDRYLLIYAQSNNISVDDLYAQSELKRIAPSELISSGFFTDLPISKALIDSVRPSVEQYVFERSA